jgi:Lar family restriction alleviation protein
MNKIVIIKPCPFCGNKDIPTAKVIHTIATGEHYMYCNKTACQMKGPIGDSLEKALEKWNRRVL